MKISTNCSPLVIYFGFFFPDKTITLAEGGGKWSEAGGGSGATGELSRRKGGTAGTNLRVAVYFSDGGALRSGGFPQHARPPGGERKRICLQRRYRVSSGHLRLLLKACTVKFIAVI